VVQGFSQVHRINQSGSASVFKVLLLDRFPAYDKGGYHSAVKAYAG
jgi:hypothetical protein